MQNSKRQAIRESRDALKAYRAESARKAAEEAAKREEKIKAALARATAREIPVRALDTYSSIIYKKAPRLFDHPTYGPVVKSWCGQTHLRSIRDWEPRGKGGETLFRSLCDHLWAKFPMPAFLWSGLVPNGAAPQPVWLAPLVKDIAQGGSLFTYSKEGRFPVKLTRAQCHELLTKTPSEFSFTSAVRRIQVKTLGGTPRLFQVWRNTTPGTHFDSPTREAFWASVIQWLGQNPMFDPTQIGPLVDYLTYRLNHDPNFSMKGRSALALMRSMQEWHGDLAKIKQTQGRAFFPSGFKEFEEERTSRDKTGNHVRAIWRIKEILGSKDLVEEGRALGHCVASYSWRIESRDVSIWSMTYEGNDPYGDRWPDQTHLEQRVCTIEVRNGNRTIVQARGRFNKMIESEPFRVMQNWARENGLSIGNLGVW